MKRAVLVFGVFGAVAACSPTNSASGDDYPIGTGSSGPSGGGSGGGGGDAGTDALSGDAGTPISGRVCVLTDLTKIGVAASCASSNVANILVTLGTRSATTRDDGTFSIIAPSGSNLYWTVTGNDKVNAIAIQTSIMPFGTDTTIPAILADRYRDLETQNGVTAGTAEQGSMFVHVLTNGAGTSGATATSSLTSQLGVLYDTTSSVTWSQDGVTGTGKAGIVWVPGILLNGASAAETVTVTPSGTGAQSRTVSAAVADQAITFTSIELK